MVFNGDDFSSGSLSVCNDTFFIDRFDCEWINDACRDTIASQFLCGIHCMNQGDTSTDDQNFVIVALFYNLRNMEWVN